MKRVFSASYVHEVLGLQVDFQYTEQQGKVLFYPSLTSCMISDSHLSSTQDIEIISHIIAN